MHSQTRFPNVFFLYGGSPLRLFYVRTCSQQWCDSRARMHSFNIGIVASTAPANRMPLGSSSVFILGSAWLYLMLDVTVGHSSS